MKSGWLVLAVAAVTAAGVARAEITAEPIKASTLHELAPIALQMIQEKFPQPPVKVDPNLEKVVGYHVHEIIAVVGMPDKALTGKIVDEAGDKDVPVGIMATRSLGPLAKDTTISADKLAVVDINGTVKIPIFFMAVKGKGEERNLELYSKDGNAIGSAPLKKVTGDASVPLGIKMTNINDEKKQVDLVFTLSGAYEGTLKMGFLDL